VRQTAAHPHHVSNLLEPVLGEIVTALSDRCRPDDEYQEKAAQTWCVIESFRPRDAIDLMVTGQLVAFNEVFADATRHLLRGMTDSLRGRTQSSLISMGRLALAQVEKLEKRGVQPYRTEAAAEQRTALAAAEQGTAPTAAEQCTVLAAPAAIASTIDPQEQPPAANSPGRAPHLTAQDPRPAPAPRAANSPEPAPLLAALDPRPPPAPDLVPPAANSPGRAPHLTALDPRPAPAPRAANPPEPAPHLTALDPRPAPAPRAANSPEPAPHLAARDPRPAPTADHAPPAAEAPAHESSWLDEPHQELLLESPAMLAAQAEAAPKAVPAVASMAPGRSKGATRSDIPPEPEAHFAIPAPPHPPTDMAVAGD